MQSNAEGPRESDDTPGDPSEAAWRSIVENYGERAEIDEPPVAPVDEPPVAAADPSAPFGGRFGNLTGGLGDEPAEPVDDESFHPPVPPPIPRASLDRLAAWIGIFGSPVVLLTALIFGISVPSLLAYALVAAFVGGFGYLVYRMPRGPRDPWDDGAQV